LFRALDPAHLIVTHNYLCLLLERCGFAWGFPLGGGGGRPGCVRGGGELRLGHALCEGGLALGGAHGGTLAGLPSTLAGTGDVRVLGGGAEGGNEWYAVWASSSSSSSSSMFLGGGEGEGI
jgi:hypothetical protein